MSLRWEWPWRRPRQAGAARSPHAPPSAVRGGDPHADAEEAPGGLAYFEQRILPPRVLGPRLTGLRALFLGTCQVEHLIPAAAQFGFTAEHVLYGSNRHDEIPALEPGRYDTVVVGLTLRTILNEAVGRAYDVFYLREFWSAEAAAAALEAATAHIAECVDAVRARFAGLPVFFMSFLEPSLNYSGNLTADPDGFDMRALVRRLNDQLSDIVRQRPNCHVFDLNEAFNLVGRMGLHDDQVSHATHASVIGGFDDIYDGARLVPPRSKLALYAVSERQKLLHSYIYNKLADNMKIIRQIDAIKIIIIDLDDTLWRGLAADSDMEDWARVEGWPLGFLEALLHYKRRGGLLAICSKNDQDVALDCMARLCGDRLKPDDFVSLKINWRPKSQNIAEILQAANLLPQSALFIDDNPREIDEVQAAFPALRCLGGDPNEWRRVILCAPETQVAQITGESRNRTGLVRAKIERDAASQTMSREDWLRSLEIEQRFHVVRDIDAPGAARALELINKTNQFNTNGRRWTAAELDALFKAGGCCLTTALKDKTVDNGVIGVAILRQGEILQAVLSCRVFGLGAELAMGAVATTMALAGRERVTAALEDTGRNRTCHDYFERLGFRAVDGGYVRDEPLSAPDWIRLTLPDELAGLGASLARTEEVVG